MNRPLPAECSPSPPSGGEGQGEEAILSILIRFMESPHSRSARMLRAFLFKIAEALGLIMVETVRAVHKAMAATALALNQRTVATLGPVSWERMIRAVEKVRNRLRRAAAALEAAGVPYAVVGGNAVAAWVSRVDEAAARNTQDVDILLRRVDLPAAIAALTQGGFVHRHVAGIDMFLEGANAKARDAVHIVFAAEKVRPDYLMPAPDVDECETTPSFRLLTLEALVRMKLTSFRDKDRTHLRDLIEVGLLDAAWVSRVPTGLGAKLQALLDNPED